MQEKLSATPFDATAQGYDLEFTETQVGRMQRAVTHRYLHGLIRATKPKTILELNCGTGEDALWLTQQGLQVTATDLSAEMVKVTAKKTVGHMSAVGAGYALPLQVRTIQSGIQGISSAFPNEKFDLIWSNFGGFNCLNPAEIQAAANELHGLLNPNGHFVAVVMGRFCAWETLYFLAKFKPGPAFRRLKKGPVQARLADGHFQDTYYYSPAEFERLMAAGFIPEKRLAVGAYLPPSYLDPFFARRPKLLERMNRWEGRAYARRFPAQFSDHFLVAFRRR